jgi:DNA topoisomerase-2
MHSGLSPLTRACQALKNKGGKKVDRLRGIDKLDDANKAGTKDGKDCTLIVTEGDSAKTLAVCGLSVVGRDTFGVFPLRGKLLNVRQAKTADMIKNKELSNLVKILGLRYQHKYQSLDELRYGKLMVMADQDVDGSHIKVSEWFERSGVSARLTQPPSPGTGAQLHQLPLAGAAKARLRR